MKLLFVFACLLACTLGQTLTMPSGAILKTLVDRAYLKFDNHHDGGFERYKFDMFIISADANSDGCMTLAEYKGFSAGTPQIATLIFNHFDPTRTDCITVDKVYYTFNQMDTDGNGKVDEHEFENYYTRLLTQLFAEANGATTAATSGPTSDPSPVG